METGTLVVQLWVEIEGAKRLATYKVEEITLNDAQLCINKEIFSHGKWETTTNRVYL